MRKVQRALWAFVKFVLSPTYVFADHRKRDAEEADDEGKTVGQRIRKYNKTYFAVAIAFALACVLWRVAEVGSEFRNARIALVVVLVWLLPISRANEIIYAFLRDAIDKVNAKDPRSDLGYGERIGLALRSYLELVVNFATVYYLMPAHWFDKPLETYPEALYYSGVTITTLGYGDFAPTWLLPQVLSVYEVFCGFSLLIVSFTVYVSRGTSETRRGKHGRGARSAGSDSRANGEPSRPG